MRFSKGRWRIPVLPGAKALLLGVLALTGLQARAWGSAGGEDAMSFMNLGVGGRPMAMGGAFTAVSDDVSAAAYNPAGLAGMRESQVSFMHQRWLADTSYSYLALAQPLSSGGTLALGGLYLGGPPIPGYDAGNISTGGFYASEGLLSIGFGQKIFSKLSVGASLKYSQQNIEKEFGSGFSGDLGLLYRFHPRVQAGFFAGNLGSRIVLVEEAARQSGMLRFGVSGRTPDGKSLASLDITRQLDDDLELRAGVEHLPFKFLAARAGYALELGGRDIPGLTGLSGGLGLRYKFIQVDYAVAPWGKLGLAHIASLILRGPPLGHRKAKRKAKALEKQAGSLLRQNPDMVVRVLGGDEDQARQLSKMLANQGLPQNRVLVGGEGALRVERDDQAAGTMPAPSPWGPPRDLRAVVKPDKVILAWNPVEGADGYNIYHSSDGRRFTKINSAPWPQTRMALGSLPKGKSSHVLVRAVRGKENGPRSEPISFRP